MDKQIPFGKRSGFTIPRANIGAMRLPADDNEAVALLRHAIDSGMRYIDTCRSYGDSELKLAKALKDGYRDKVILSTKWSPWISKIEPDDDASADRVLRRIEESMKRLEVEYLDFYQIWNIQSKENYEEAIRPNGFLEGVIKAREKGLVGHIGITSHAPVDDLLTWLDEIDWCEVILLTYNLLGTTYAPVLAKAKQKGIGTIVMNPVAGGKLGENSPLFADLVKKTGSRDMADMAVRYVLSNNSVDTIISGISKTADVDDTIDSARTPLLTPNLVREIEQFVEKLTPVKVAFCTACGYCMPCPQEVNIPRVMEAIYNQRILKFDKNAQDLYNMIGHSWITGKQADACTNCGECVPKCTQKLNIPDEMAYAEKKFGTS